MVPKPPLVQPSAYKTVDEARGALRTGIEVLKVAAKKAYDATPPNKKKGKALDFCEGCLIDLERALTMTKLPTTPRRPGVNDGC